MGSMLRLTAKLAALTLLIGVAGCSETHGDADYAAVEKGFAKEMTVDQRKAAIEDLQKHPKSDE
jgi:hypothetical protein